MKHVPYRITKYNQKQPIPKARLAKTTIHKMIDRLKQLETTLARYWHEVKEAERANPNIMIKTTNRLLHKPKNLGKSSYFWYWTPVDPMEYESLIASQRKELEFIAKDPVYRRYILLYKLSME